MVICCASIVWTARQILIARVEPSATKRLPDGKAWPLRQARIHGVDFGIQDHETGSSGIRQRGRSGNVLRENPTKSRSPPPCRGSAGGLYFLCLRSRVPRRYCRPYCIRLDSPSLSCSMGSHRWILLICAVGGTGTGYSSDGRFFRGRSLARRLRPYRANAQRFAVLPPDVRAGIRQANLERQEFHPLQNAEGWQPYSTRSCSCISNRQDPIGSTEGCAVVAALRACVGANRLRRFPKKSRKGRIYTIEFFLLRPPGRDGRFGGFVFRKDSHGRPLVNTACEEEGARFGGPTRISGAMK